MESLLKCGCGFYGQGKDCLYQNNLSKLLGRIVGNWEEKMAKQGKFPMDTDLKHKNDQSEISFCEVDLSLFPVPFVFNQLEHTILNWYS